MLQLSELGSWIEGQKADFLEQLDNLVTVNTYTANTRGVDGAMDMLSRLAEKMDFQVGVIYGRHRRVKFNTPKQGPRVLLIAHMDTVHPPEGEFQHNEYLNQDVIRGPGVGDMKAGLLMGLWTLKAMRDINPAFDVQMVVSADEETGSPSIQEWYLTGKSQAAYALGLEPGFPQGELSATVPMGVVYQRKGTYRINFTLRGVAAHAGGAWERGVSAVEALAHRVLKIHALSNPERGITTNVGLASGGTAANTIAEFSRGSVDIRFLTEQDGQETLEAVKRIIYEPVIQNTVIDKQEEVEQFSVEVYMPPMKKTADSDRMIEIVLQESQRLGQTIVPIARGGGSDANYISNSGVPAICGMGAAAEGIHTLNEHIHVPLTFARLELLIATAYRLVTENPVCR